jgi:hypothetical protein
VSEQAGLSKESMLKLLAVGRKAFLRRERRWPIDVS